MFVVGGLSACEPACVHGSVCVLECVCALEAVSGYAFDCVTVAVSVLVTVLVGELWANV